MLLVWGCEGWVEGKGSLVFCGWALRGHRLPLATLESVALIPRLEVRGKDFAL